MLEDALRHISVSKFYKKCGYSYLTIKHGGHEKVKYVDLPPNMKEGIWFLINNIYRVQKMVYCYNLDYVNHCMKDCCIKLKPFYQDCNITRYFHKNYILSVNRDERVMVIRCELIRMINRMMDYVLE